MTVPTVPANAQPTAGPSHPGRSLTVWSYVVNVAYLAWFWVMFAASYWVYSLFDLDPGAGDVLSSEGALGWLAAMVFGVVTALPSWVGAWLALRARTAGAGVAAVISLVLNLMLAVGYLALVILTM
jgi:hypothetical protein